MRIVDRGFRRLAVEPAYPQFVVVVFAVTAVREDQQSHKHNPEDRPSSVPTPTRQGPLFLVPKLCLGTQVREALHRVFHLGRMRISLEGADAKRSFGTCVPKQS